MNLTKGTARDCIEAAEVARLRTTGVLVEDARRERPRYFDGRFLAARDLIRDQQYFLAREADLGSAAGSGIATGLFVDQGRNAQTLRIGSGHGITPAGELALLPRDLEVPLANLPLAEQLSARFGLSRRPAAPMRGRTGLFVLALRPVEFTDNPIGAYPTSITGPRQVEDADIVEATAAVLVPWQDDGAADALDARRGTAARAIFVAGRDAGLSANLLPLAMIALQNNTIAWIDEAMVRRELGADRGDLPGLGFAPRALRLAHLMQYQGHLADLVAKGNGSTTFPASAYFPALPSAGPLPPAAIDVTDFTQSFFPAEIDVDFSIVPEDELPALVEETLALPPIDLTVAPEGLSSTSVLILAPVPRHEWAAVVAQLTTRTRILKPAAPNLLAQRKPLEILQRLRLLRPAVAPPDPGNPSDAEWQRLARQPNLWFVRRRHLAYRDDFAGEWQQLAGRDERTLELRLRERLHGLGLADSLDGLLSRATPAATGSIIALLASTRFSESPVLTAAALGSLVSAARDTGDGSQAGQIDYKDVLEVGAELTAPGAGKGLLLMEATVGADRVASESLQKLAADQAWKDVDQAAKVANKAGLKQLATTTLRLRA